MFAKVFVVAAFASVALAGFVAPTDSTTNSCNVAHQYCCNQVQDAKSVDATKAIAGLANVDVGSITGQVGLTCNPISVIGVNANSCNAQPTCCTGNNFNGAVVVGCTPISATA